MELETTGVSLSFHRTFCQLFSKKVITGMAFNVWELIQLGNVLEFFKSTITDNLGGGC